MKVASGIRTFTEGTDQSSSQIVAIRQLAQSARHIVFLGFAFHALNVELLFPNMLDSNSSGGPELIVGTAQGISVTDRDHIASDLAQRTNPARIELNGWDCTQLFSEFNRTLSFLRPARG